MFSGVERPWKGGGGMLGLWVDLGDEMEENWRLGRGLVSGRKRRGKCCGIQRKEKEICLGILSGFQLSLPDGKRH